LSEGGPEESAGEFRDRYYVKPFESDGPDADVENLAVQSSENSLEQALEAAPPEIRTLVDSLRAERDMYKREARIDTLTDLPNRRAVEEWVQPRIESIFKHRQGEDKREGAVTKLVLAIIDIDHFKSVNDTLGHEMGDEVLRWMATTARASVRSTDMVARIGGEEFVIIMENVTLQEAAERVEVVRRNIEEYSQDQLDNWQMTDREALTASFGLAEFSKACEKYADMFQGADAALYKAKEHRNRVVTFNSSDPDMAAHVRKVEL